MSKLVKKAAEHAARKQKTQQKAQYTLKPNQLDENTVNRLIGFAVIITIVAVVTLLLAVANG